ncbi:cell division cycle 7-related protein kinase [Drosophila sulfurigaster albostrigata]|uniref:cell division cycle 7-related protein kinase n=1 Tax=Drosophila sulfurigaster albostrigata TaxID=89887 RepID=UPI002D21A044|nr:cell division cycle 7-related protein kinase [Drosophila sulfurigaster albostrigata]
MLTKFIFDKMDKKLQHSHHQQKQQHQHHTHASYLFNNNQSTKSLSNPLQAKLVAMESKLKHGSISNVATATTGVGVGMETAVGATTSHTNNRSLNKPSQHFGLRQVTLKDPVGHRERERHEGGRSTNAAGFKRYCVPQTGQQQAQQQQPQAQPIVPLLSQVQRVNHDLADKLNRLARRNTIKFKELTALQGHDKNTEALQELQTSIPEISKIFDVHCRIGSGTFSTVLLGTLQRERQLPEAQRRRFAIKHHNPTNHPERILRELECMFRMGGDHNVIGINCCIRYNDNVAFVMPFMSHDRFHDIYRNLSLLEIKDYLRNLLVALQHVHKFKVIHRDVKPSNILYNRRTGKFLLCDFGLAQRLADDGSLIQASDLSGAAALMRDMDAAQQQLMQREGNSLQDEADAERRIRAAGGGTAAFGEPSMTSTAATLLLTEPTKRELAAQKADTQRLINRLRYVNSNVDPNNYVVSTNSSRKEMHASRAGTPGYRPPEVLLRYPYQTTAVDVWAAGVIMLSMLSSLHPFFKAPNDCAALSEIMNLFGDLQVRKTAFMLDRLVLITQKVTALDLRRVCMRFRYANHFLSPEMQRRHRRSDGSTELCRLCEQSTFNCICKHSCHALETYNELDMFPHHAYDLLSRLLEVNPQKRITAEEALKHPFFGEHHRIASGVPLHQLQQQRQQQQQQQQQQRSRDSLPSAGSRTLTPYVSYPNGTKSTNLPELASRTGVTASAATATQVAATAAAAAATTAGNV